MAFSTADPLLSNQAAVNGLRSFQLNSQRKSHLIVRALSGRVWLMRSIKPPNQKHSALPIEKALCFHPDLDSGATESLFSCFAPCPMWFNNVCLQNAFYVVSDSIEMASKPWCGFTFACQFGMKFKTFVQYIRFTPAKHCKVLCFIFFSSCVLLTTVLIWSKAYSESWPEFWAPLHRLFLNCLGPHSHLSYLSPQYCNYDPVEHRGIMEAYFIFNFLSSLPPADL